MERNMKILQNATESLRHFVKTFDLFRSDNFLLNDLLGKIESLLETAEFKSKSEFILENENKNSYIDNGKENLSQHESQVEVNQLHIEQESESSHFPGKNITRDHLYTQNGSVTSESEMVNLSHTTEEIQATPEKPAEDQVFAIDLLRRLILGNLSPHPPDLKSCRLVSPTWNSTATQILLDMRAFKIKFDFKKVSEDGKERPCANANQNFQSFRVDDYDEHSCTDIKKLNDWHDLVRLSKIMDNGIQFSSKFQIPFPFPCNSFCFYFANLGSENLQYFLKRFGHIVKHLEISLYYDGDGDELCDDDDYTNFNPQAYTEHMILRLFRELLWNHLPNLESLVVGGFPRFWFQSEDKSELFPEPRVMRKSISNLKSVRFSAPPPQKILDDILESCPSLRNVGMCDGSEKLVLNSFIEMNRVHLLTEFRTTLSPKNLDYYDNFLCRNLKDVHLKKLVLRVVEFSDSGYWMRVSRVFTSFLRSSSESLTELHTEPLGDCVGIQIPIMPNLKKIHLLDCSSKSSSIKLFPEGLRLSEVFPRLESFVSSVVYTLDHSYSEQSWNEYVGASSKDLLESVKHLRFDYGPPAEWTEKLCALFPNLVTVKIGILQDFREAAKTLWKLERLKNLCVGFNLINLRENDREDRNAYPAIDAAFTGFSCETCLQLHNDSRSVDVSELNERREFPSILDAKNLTSLNLLISDTSYNERDEEIVPVMSHVTGLFAFKLCPQLRINLCASSIIPGVNMRNLLRGLSPIIPYVHTFQQRKSVLN